MDELDSEWQRKGGTLSDKTARKEYGLTEGEIVQAVRGGELHYRPGPFLRLLRREVEALVEKKDGDGYLKNQQAKTKLDRINRELRRLRTRIAALEKRKVQLTANLGM